MKKRINGVVYRIKQEGRRNFKVIHVDRQVLLQRRLPVRDEQALGLGSVTLEASRKGESALPTVSPLAEHLCVSVKSTVKSVSYTHLDVYKRQVPVA